jgi:hypothetical protein
LLKIIKLILFIILDKEPEYIVYDDACHLRRYLENSKNHISKTDRLNNLCSKKFVVDKLHIQGHTERWCHLNCHPNLFPDLTDINTVVCEQINFILGRYKYIIKHMSAERCNFYIYILLNELNKIKLDGRNEVLGFQIQHARTLLKNHLDLSSDEE